MLNRNLENQAGFLDDITRAAAESSALSFFIYSAIFSGYPDGIDPGLIQSPGSEIQPYEVKQEVEFEQESKLIVLVDSPDAFNWENDVYDVYDETGLARVRIKNGLPRVGVKIPMPNHGSKTQKYSKRVEWKPKSDIGIEAYFKHRERLSQEKNSQFFHKMGARLSLANGKQVWINKDDRLFWIDIDGGNEQEVINNLPEGITAVGFDDSHVKVNGFKQLTYSQFTDRHLANLSATSRTAKTGVVDTTVSADKAAGTLPPDETMKKVLLNNEKACQAILQHRHDALPDSSELRRVFEQLAYTLGESIEENPLQFRTWPVKYGLKIEPEMLQTEVSNFYDEVWRRLTALEAQDSSREEVLEFAGWVEWMVDAGLHYFADGCGRKSKIFSTFIFARLRELQPEIDSRENYYQAMNAGLDTFITYYKERGSASVTR